jgi:hypothetical protein
MIFLDLFRQAGVVVAGGKRHDLEPARMRVNDGKRALADRAGGAENREALHMNSLTNR